MGTYYTQQKPLSFEENQIRGLEHAKSYGEFQPFKDTWDGISDESGWVMGAKRLYDEIMGNRAWPIDENYNYKADPQLQGYDAVIEQFAFSKSAEETAWMLEEKRQDALVQKESPFYFLGRITGAVTDPTTYLAWKVKAARSALAFGSALTTEEIIKQNIDPFRQDDIVPWVATGGFVIPAMLNKFTSNIPAKVADETVALDAQWNKSTITTKVDDTGTKIYEDGILVDANKLDSPPSSVGSAGIKSNVTSSPAKRMEGEAFIKTRLKWFGEDGPWTPVFRVVKSSSLTGKKMMESLLDTPLLKIKNTPAHKFTATEGSIETKMKVMKVDELEAHMAVRNLYLDYIGRLQGENAKPATNIGLYLHNRLTPNRLTLNEFSKEVAKARIMKSHPIKEVDEAARIYGEKVYDKLWKEIDELGIREMPIKKEMNLWEGVLEKMKKDNKGVVEFFEPSTKTRVKYSKTEVENLLKDLKDLMARVKSGSKVDNYINRIYLKDAIKAKPEVFRRIIIENNKRQGITMNKKALDDLIEDLSNYFPFQRFEKTPWEKWLKEWEAFGKGGVKGLDEFLAHKRFIFNKDRYARSLRARTLNLDAKAQLELIDEGLIMSDIFGLGKAYTRQMIPDILLTRKFGDPNGKGYSYISEAESMTSPGLLTVANEYAMKLIGKKGKTRIALIKERDQVLADLEASIELLRGTFGLPSDPHAWYSIAMRTMKHYNTLTMLTGFMAAVPDAARIVMTSGIKRGFRTQFDLFGNFLADGKLFKLSKAEARSAGEAWDLITGQRAALMGDVGDMFGVANQIERGMGKLAHFNFMYINMMSRWTEFAKSLASVTIGSRIIEDSIKWSKAGSKPLDIQYIKIPEGKAMASFNRANNQVVMDLERIKKTFDNKAWTKPRIEGVDPLPANQFKTFDEWKDFIYFHELSHWKNPRIAGETLAAYENRMNKLALNKDNIKALKKAVETEGIAIGGLADKWKTALASSGIDEQMAKRIAAQFEEHGTKTQYNFMANTAAWTDDLARNAFRNALNKDINITIVTPGLGDTPKWMSYELGSVFSQFKKFAMGAQQRMLMRGMQEQDADFMFGALLLMGSGMFIDAVYHKTRFNRDYNKLSLTQKLLNAFDRSGLGGIYTDINKALETISDNRIGISPMLGESKPYGSSMRWKMGTIGGPTGGQLYNIADILFDIGGKKYNHHTAKNVRRLIPFQNVWYLDWLFDDLQKGLKFK